MTHSEYIQLVNTLKLHDYRYFTLNAPVITDEEYDRLYFMAQDYETAHTDEVLADSPTQSAHGEVKNGHKQIRRRTEMLSTEKAQTIEKVQKWMTKTTKKINSLPCGEGQGGVFTVEWKYDGISLSLVYIDGQLTEASYGKGMEGNDCLAHCLQVASIPNTIPATGRVEVRGEMVVPFANLAKTGYKNCRSAASGIMADTASTLTDCLEFHPYWTDANIGNNCRYRVEKLAKRYGFLNDTDLNTLHQFVELNNLEEVIEYATNRRASLPYPTDGLVIKVDKMEQWDSLGRNDHHPHYAIAYKFAAATAETTVTRIEITTGKTGKRTPVAYFEPITINGATYQKASIGSEAKLAELGITAGSRVIVSLRNDVIPHIEKTHPYNPLPSEGGEAYTPAVEEPIVMADPEIEENSCHSCNSCSEEPPYTAPALTPVTPADTLCSGYPPRNDRPRRPRRYTMVGEPRTRIATARVSNDSLPNGDGGYSVGGSFPTGESGDRGFGGASIIGATVATIAIIGIAIALFSTIGIAVFLLPLLAGAFK